MKAYICDHCRKVIEEDDNEAIEILELHCRALFDDEKEQFRKVRQNVHDSNQNVHYCGECKVKYYNDWII